MIMSLNDVELFYKSMFQLQLFVNRKLQVFPDYETVDDLKNLVLTDRVKLRDAVYANPELIDKLVKATLELAKVSVHQAERRHPVGISQPGVMIPPTGFLKPSIQRT